MNALEVKEAARALGADLVGIAPVDRLAAGPPEQHPATVLPTVKSVIVVGHRILRGALRGIEEGTNFGSTYQTYGLTWVENFFLSRTVYELTCRLEDAGIEAVPFLPQHDESDVFRPDFPAYACAAGLGRIGRGGFFLSPEYGHRQRLAIILTDAALAGDEACTLDFCAGCRACLAGCPLGAIREVPGEPGFRIDFDLCLSCKNGAFETPGHPDPADRCAAACGRACLTALEERVGNRFEQQFRKRSVWSIGPDGNAATGKPRVFIGGVCPASGGSR